MSRSEEIAAALERWEKWSRLLSEADDSDAEAAVASDLAAAGDALAALLRESQPEPAPVVRTPPLTPDTLRRNLEAVNAIPTDAVPFVPMQPAAPAIAVRMPPKPSSAPCAECGGNRWVSICVNDAQDWKPCPVCSSESPKKWDGSPEPARAVGEDEALPPDVADALHWTYRGLKEWQHAMSGREDSRFDIKTAEKLGFALYHMVMKVCPLLDRESRALRAALDDVARLTEERDGAAVGEDEALLAEAAAFCDSYGHKSTGSTARALVRRFVARLSAVLSDLARVRGERDESDETMFKALAAKTEAEAALAAAVAEGDQFCRTLVDLYDAADETGQPWRRISVSNALIDGLRARAGRNDVG